MNDFDAHELISELIERADLEDLPAEQAEDLCQWMTKVWAERKWIAVTDRLPKHGTHVLAFHPDWGVSTGVSLGDGAHGRVSGDWAGETNATHWRPLPDPPPASTVG